MKGHKIIPWNDINKYFSGLTSEGSYLTPLVTLFTETGTKIEWAFVASEINARYDNGRTASACKNKYYRLKRKKVIDDMLDVIKMSDFISSQANQMFGISKVDAKDRQPFYYYKNADAIQKFKLI